ncbi:glutathione-dependent formaldehyde-activating GFA [Hypoxylon sp. FL1284]|nr:glutathione-dependent formaldehyde-activating GFA [Hypoxylon sp. FL1284]
MSGQTSIDDFAKPESVTGGCLCGAIRYRASFPKDHDFKKLSGSCQCTQCRRNTGTLIFMAHTVALRDFAYLTAAATLKNFYATPGIQRGFCGACGSTLYWRDESRDDVEIAVGCVDPECLAEYGFALANASGNNVWCQNEIPGVSDRFVGTDRGVKWATSSEEGVRM